jgi:hypothetical protein
VLFADGAIQLFVLVGDFYGRYPFVEKEFIELQEILANFQTGGESRQDYMEKLAGCVNRLGESLKEELDSFLTSELARIVILPEQFELPLLGCIMAHPGLRRRAKDGKLAVNVCPVLHPHFSTTSDLSSLTTCFFKGDNLKLLGEEMQLVKGILPSTSVRTVELSPEVDLFSVLASSIVHFAAHGVPISNFSDAFFSTSHPAKFGLSVSSLQTVAWTTPHQIVFLNACFTADTLNWNVFQGFKTNEQIGLPSTLLLNRRAVVIASSWTTFDVAGYLVAAKFYGNLRHDAEPDIAFAKALAELVEMTSEELVDLLSGIQDERLRTEKQRLFADGAQPFRHPYVNGTYQFISLL